MTDTSEITLRASGERVDKTTRAEQIQQVIDASYVNGGPIRVRIPVTMYLPGKKTASELREAAWNLTLPSTMTAAQVEEMIAAIGRCLEAIVREGSAEVERRLEGGPTV